MAFFRRANGQYVMHRVLRAEKSGALYLVGDAQQEVEGPIAPQQVFAVVTEVCRKENGCGRAASGGIFLQDLGCGCCRCGHICADSRALCRRGLK